VTDNPVSETYWKVANGIRLTGMPAFKTKLTDTQVWQVSQLIAHTNEISDSVKRTLVTDVTMPAGSAPNSKDK
jgi:thiosulfate dehydrogenase